MEGSSLSKNDGVNTTPSTDVNKDWFKELPDEVLAPILKLATQESSWRELVKLRLVSQQWKDVIDEHFDFPVTINEEKMDVTQLSHVRVKRCIINMFNGDVRENVDIFRDSGLLKKLFVWGLTSIENLQKMIEWASSLRELSLASTAFLPGGLAVPFAGEKFTTFWQNLEKFAMSLEAHYFSNEVQPVVCDNVQGFLGCPMANLKRLTMLIDCDNLQQTNIDKMSGFLINFLGDHPNLQMLQVRIRYLFGEPSAYSPNIDECLQRKLSQVKLQTLALSVSPMQLSLWIRVLRLMGTLKNLRITVIHLYSLIDNSPPEINLFNYLGDALIANQKTLNSIQIENFFLTRPLDASIFQDMGNLKRLVLQKGSVKELHLLGGVEVSNIVNLNQLPETIEVLSIIGMKALSEELYLMADRVDEIKHLELTNIGKFNPFGVTQDVLASFAEKENICSMAIRPINNDSANVGVVNVRSKDGIINEVNILNAFGYVFFDFQEYRQS